MNKVTPKEQRMARRLTQIQYNSGNMLNDMRGESKPEEQLLNAYKLGMRFPEWVSFEQSK